MAVTPNTSDVTLRAANAICGALFRCCETGLADYFAPYRDHELLKAFRDQLPPAATLDEPRCRMVVKDMLDIVPLGDWVHAAEAGSINFDMPAFDTCIAKLNAATCGAPVRDALWDSTCLGFAPPNGGEQQRSFIHRTAAIGDACSPIRDGFGGTFYGTCNPTTEFCCYADAGHSGCQLPFASGGTPRSGTCAAVAPVGADCSVTPPLALCAPGNDCSSDTAKCVAPSTGALSLGDTCVDSSFELLGDCKASWCDVLGSEKCEPLLDDNQTCTAPEQCHSGHCDHVCKPIDLCEGSSVPPGADAGVPSGTSDASVDAAPSTAAGETCSQAPSLAAASSPSPLTGYTSRVTGPFGVSNDYNPLTTSGLPPACSIVYDAQGLEVAYAVTLAPNDRLRVHAVLADGKQPAIYLLDSCPSATWPDFDGSTRCGSNEYNVGLCGIGGCDPAVLDIRYPTTLGGQATSTKTFYLVIDQVGGSTSTGFVVDWSVTH